MITAQQLAQSSLFTDLPEDSLARFVSLADEITRPAGSTLFSEGETANHLYILLSGKIVIQVTPTGQNQPLTFVSLSIPGQLVGWSGFMPPNYYTATAVCQQDCRLIAFEGMAFNRLLDDDPVSGLMIMRRVAGTISQRLRTIQNIVLKSMNAHDEM